MMSADSKRRVVAAVALVVAMSFSGAVSAQLSGPTRGEGGYFRIGVGPAVTQDVESYDFTLLPGIAGTGGVGIFLDERFALELNIDSTAAWHVNEQASFDEPSLVVFGAHAALRAHVDRAVPELYVIAGLGPVAESSVADSDKFLGAGLTTAVGWESERRGFGALAHYTPRVLTLFSDPHFVHSLAVSLYLALGL